MEVSCVKEKNSQNHYKCDEIISRVMPLPFNKQFKDCCYIFQCFIALPVLKRSTVVLPYKNNSQTLVQTLTHLACFYHRCVVC